MADPRYRSRSQSVKARPTREDFAFDKSCSHTKRWAMAFFVMVAFDSTSRTRIVPVACGSTKQSSFTSMAFGGQPNRSGYDVDCHCQTKLFRHVLEQPLPVKVARLVVLNCGIIFLALGRGEMWLSSQVFMSTLGLNKRLSDKKKSPPHLLSACELDVSDKRKFPHPTPTTRHETFQK